MKAFRCVASTLCTLVLLTGCWRDEDHADLDTMPAISGQPSSVYVIEGNAATFGVVATGTEPLTYQWYQDGLPLPGDTNATLTTSAMVLADSGLRQFSVLVSNALGSVASDTATVFVYEEGNLLAPLLNFAETGARNWNHGGHQVDDRFYTGSYGWWAYEDSTFEPWLFDRPEAWRMLSEMTGDPRWLAQANADLAYYESRLSPAGLFLNKGSEADTKYTYVHSWGVDATKQAAAYDATVAGFPNTPSPAPAALWTEREVWVALDAAVKYSLASGNAGALIRAQAMVDQWDTVSAGRGAPLVTYTKHEGGGPGGSTPTDLVSSPWMSALYFQAARLYVQQVPAAAAQVHRQASDYFDWLNVPGNRGFYPGSEAHPQYTGLVFPAYLAGGTLLGDAGPSEDHMGHAIDVAGFIAFAIRAKQALGLPTSAAEARLVDMKLTAMIAFDDQTRDTDYLPKYRVNPARKFLWWTRGMYELWSNDAD